MSLMLALLLTVAQTNDAPPGPPPPPPGPESGVQISDSPRAATIQTMTEDQAMARLSELKKDRPSLVGPIVMLSIGGVLAIPGIYFLIATLEVTGTTVSTMNGLVRLFGAVAGVILGFFTVVFLLPAAILVTIGGILLPLRLAAIGERNREQEELELRLRNMGQREGAQPPPPPPPLPPSQVNLVIPGPYQTVAVF